MKLQIPLLLVSLLFVSQHNYAQLISKKEQQAIRNLHTELVSAYHPEAYLLKGGWVLSMEPGMEAHVSDIRISEGIIEEIGTNLDVEGYQVIDVSGKYLIPGLTDSHVHFFSKHQMTPTWLIMSVLHGVTSVRDMAGEPGKLELRAAIEQNQLFGPTIYQAGPIINGEASPFAAAHVETETQAAVTVAQQAAMGYDFIKVYNDLSPEVLKAIYTEASENDIPVGGHVPTSVALSDALGMMNTIEHLTGYLKWEEARVYLAVNQDHFSRTEEMNVWNCPTLFQLVMNWDKSNVEDIFNNSEISSLLPSKLIDRWERMLNENSPEKTARLEAYGDQNTTVFMETTRGLFSAGAGLLVGTDAGNLPFLIPGYSFHKEYQTMFAAGISHDALLRMATSNASEALGKSEEFGTLSVGKRADILVLNTNPSTELISTEEFQGIMLRGAWLSSDDLISIKERLREIFE